MKLEEISTLDWAKGDGLLPAVVQHATSGAVLMLAFMNREALRETLTTGRVFFYSRTRKAQWMKGETSGHVLNVVGISVDCDRDSLLILAEPEGPVCHRGTRDLLCRSITYGSGRSFLPCAPRDGNCTADCAPAGGQLHGEALCRGSVTDRAEDR